MKTDMQVRNPKFDVRVETRRSRLNGSERRVRLRPSVPEWLRRGILVRLLPAVVVTVTLTGCFGFLKPVRSTSRHFVLTPLPAPPLSNIAPGSPAVGMGQVKLASYLFNSSFAVRRGTNEIDYSSSTLWAERLDTGLQRVLAANLAVLLPTDQIRLSSWQTSDVSIEVFVAIERFDVDANGRAVLVAWWRILSPGGEKLLKGGEARFARQGPQPDADPAGAVATLSGLAADLSHQLAEAVKQVQPTIPRAQ